MQHDLVIRFSNLSDNLSQNFVAETKYLKNTSKKEEGLFLPILSEVLVHGHLWSVLSILAWESWLSQGDIKGEKGGAGEEETESTNQYILFRQVLEFCFPNYTSDLKYLLLFCSITNWGPNIQPINFYLHGFKCFTVCLCV